VGAARFGTNPFRISQGARLSVAAWLTHQSETRQTMSNAPQGPGWWQASDGNWYPPQQQPGYAPPPAPPSWSAPAAYPQYPAPGGQTFGAAPAALGGSLANFSTAAWLLVAGLVIGQLSDVFPTWTVSADGGTHIVRSTASDWVGDIVMNAVFAVLIWAAFAGPRMRLGPLIALTVLNGLWVIGVIGSFTFLVPSSGSPAFGVFVGTAACGLSVVGNIMAWASRSQAPQRPY
jgi:hypothetical protein